MNVVQCQKCKGQGSYSAFLRDLSGKNSDGYGTFHHFISCDAPGCHNGIVNRKEYYDTWKFNDDLKSASPAA